MEFNTSLDQSQQSDVERRRSISSMSSASGYDSSTYGGERISAQNTSTAAIHPNTTGNSLLSSRVSQSRHFGSNTPISNLNTPMFSQFQQSIPVHQQHVVNPNSNTPPNQQGNINLSSPNSQQHLQAQNQPQIIPPAQSNQSTQPAQHGQQPQPHASQQQAAQLTGSTNNSFNPNWLPQQHSNTLMNVTPWIEQQAQVSPNINMQNLTMSYTGGNDGNQQLATNLSLLASSSMIPSAQLSQQQQLRQPQYLNNSSKRELLNGNSSNIATSAISCNMSPPNQEVLMNNQDMKLNDDDDDVIPTAIVIKNIPFAIKKEQLLDVMSKLNLPLPYAFNYHFDNGVFRGLAFANFNSIEETAMVVTILNGREIGGRKLRVEYKKMLPLVERERIEREKREKRGQLEEQHRSTSATSLASLYSIASAPPTTSIVANLNVTASNPIATTATASANLNSNNSFSNKINERSFVSIPQNHQLPIPPSGVDFNNPETLEIFTRLTVFKEEYKNPTSIISELAFAIASLTPVQRRTITSLCQFLGLIESLDNGYVIVRRPDYLILPPQSQLQSQGQHLTGGAFPPSLIRSQSHNILNNAAAGLNLNANRFRQQSPRTVSQTQQFPYNQQQSLLLSQQQSNAASLQQFQQQTQQQQTANQLHHSSSTASLNLLRTNGLNPPTTPNPGRTGLFTTANTTSGLFNTNQQPGFNSAQLTGGSTMSANNGNSANSAKGVENLFAGMENLSFGGSNNNNLGTNTNANTSNVVNASSSTSTTNINTNTDNIKNNNNSNSNNTSTN